MVRTVDQPGLRRRAGQLINEEATREWDVELEWRRRMQSTGFCGVLCEGSIQGSMYEVSMLRVYWALWGILGRDGDDAPV